MKVFLKVGDKYIEYIFEYDSEEKFLQILETAGKELYANVQK